MTTFVRNFAVLRKFAIALAAGTILAIGTSWVPASVTSAVAAPAVEKATSQADEFSSARRYRRHYRVYRAYPRYRYYRRHYYYRPYYGGYYYRPYYYAPAPVVPFPFFPFGPYW